jgi:hypothetical protein
VLAGFERRSGGLLGSDLGRAKAAAPANTSARNAVDLTFELLKPLFLRP